MSVFEDAQTLLWVMNVASGLTDDTEGVDSLPNGAVAFFNAGTGATEQSAITSSDSKFFVAFRDSDGVLHKSGLFKGSTVKRATWRDTEALTEQVTYVGYNGTDGSLDASNSTYYSIRLVLNHTFGLMNNSPMLKTIPYKSSASATQEEVARGLANAGIVSFARGVNQDVLFERVCDEAGTDLLVGTGNITVVNGSKVITAATDIDNAMAVGDWFRAGTAVTDPVYEIVAMDTTAQTATLDIAYQGASETIGYASANFVANAAAVAAEWGLKLTGNSIADAAFKPVSETPFVVNFKVELGENFSTAEARTATESYIGSGTYQLLAAQEAYTQFQQKDRTIEAYPPTTRMLEATSGSAYNLVAFEVEDKEFVSATTGINPISPARIVIACLDSTCDTDYGYFKTVVGATQTA